MSSDYRIELSPPDTEPCIPETLLAIPIKKRSLPDRLAYLAAKLDEVAEDGITADVRPIAFALRMLAEELEQASHE